MDFKHLMVAAFFIWITPAHAERAWKCTAANGSITFQNMPCTGANLTDQEMIKIDTVNHIGRGVTSGERYRTNAPNSIQDPSGVRYRSQGSNWNQPQDFSQPPRQNQNAPASNHTVSNCDQINSRIDQIQRELRAGYNAKRGNRLKRERNDLYIARRASCR